MAKTSEKKKKKTLAERVMMDGASNNTAAFSDRPHASKWAMFKELFFHRMGTMSGLNLLTVFFALPAAFVIIYFAMNINVNSGLVPYSSNLGIGYPVVVDAVRLGEKMTYTYHIYEFACLIPCIALFAVGLSGNMYVMRKLLWGEPVRTVRDFFGGIKKCWLAAMLTGVVFGAALLFFVFTLGYFDAYAKPAWAKGLSIAFALIVLILVGLISAFVLTQNAAFKMGGTALIRNSILFVFGTHVLSLFFVGIAIAPAFLAFIPGIMILFLILYMFLGFSYSSLVLTLYCHSCYERFLYDKIEASPKTYLKRDESDDMEDAAGKSRGKRQAPVPYKNPKKRKKSIDEGKTITPLPTMFRREDLERLERERNAILNAPDDDEEELEDDEDEAQGAAGAADVPAADGEAIEQKDGDQGDK